jgi:uncharacterized protein with HEPN domain
MSPDQKLRLTHIDEAAALIADYLKSVSKEAFLNDRLRQDAVIRRIQVVDRRDGKAAKEVQANPRGNGVEEMLGRSTFEIAFETSSLLF